MTNKIIILKLGGSAITEKMTGQPKIRKTVITQIAKELKLFIRRFPKSKIILLHGAGSFGHPIVSQYKLLEKPLTGKRILGFAKTVYSTRLLGNLLTNAFHASKIPVFPIQAGTVLNEKNGCVNLSNIKNLKQLLDAGFIPLLGGDMSLKQKNKPIVVSADKLAVLLAESFPSSRVIFATDVNGVFEKFPPSKKVPHIPIISRKSLKKMLKKTKTQRNKYDVTGGMNGKLKTILSLGKKEIIIFNGQKPGNLSMALLGQPVGTRII